MSSGYFPLEHKGEYGARLVSALDAIEAVLDENWLDYVTPDDAQRDGGYLAELRLAANFIHGALDFSKKPDCASPDHKYARCRAYRYSFGNNVIRHRCDACGIDGHDSDCATHNEPATPNGPCDCSIADEIRKRTSP